MRILIWILLIYVVYRIVRGKQAQQIKKEPAGTEFFQDPVCGVYVSEADAVVGKLEEKRHYFCSMECLKEFEKQLQQR